MSPDVELKLLQDVAVIKRDVAGLNKAVNGNGKPGMYDRLGIVEVDVKNVDKKLCTHIDENEEAEAKEEKRKAGRTDFTNKIWLLVIGVLVTQVGAAFLGDFLLSLLK